MIRFLLIALALITYINSPAQANKNYKAEALAFEKECHKDDKLPLYFECECMAKDFLNACKKLGPEASKSAVRSQLGVNCKNAAGAAKKMYEECLKQTMFIPKGHNPEEFCGCYGDSFKRSFENLPGAMSARTEIALKSRARTKCSSPKTYNRIYRGQ